MRPGKLYQQLLDNPRGIVPFRDFVRCLTASGFEHIRSRGSHRSYKHPNVDEVLTVQPRGKDAQPYQVRKFLAMVREFDLKLDD